VSTSPWGSGGGVILPSVPAPPLFFFLFLPLLVLVVLVAASSPSATPCWVWAEDISGTESSRPDDEDGDEYC